MSELKWTSHPLKEDKRKSAILIAFLVLIVLLVSLSFDSIALTALSAVLLVGSLRAFFIPTRYALDEKGISVESPVGKRTRSWSEFKSYYADNNGVLLSPFPDKSILESFRGVYLMCRNNRQEVIDFIKTKIDGKTD